MDESQWLVQRFEENRGHLEAVAYRILGSLVEADDAVQETWLRLNRSGREGVENLGGWLTTVVAHVCLDMLRARNSRREDSFDDGRSEPIGHPKAADPEKEAVLADSVGLALLVVLDRLAPAERLAFVLHDMFDLPYEEIGQIVGRSPSAARQLASRARRRVRGGAIKAPTQSSQRRLVEAFLAALQAGDFEGLVAVLDPDVVIRSDQARVLTEQRKETRGAEFWARQAISYARGAKGGRLALVNGEAGIVVAPRGKLFRVLRFTVRNGRIAQMEVIGDRERLAKLDLAVLDR